MKSDIIPTKKPKNAGPDDLAHLKNVARKMLYRLEQAVDEPEVGSDHKDSPQMQKHERLFGSKTSLAATLVTLAELMLKLEHAGIVSDGFEDMTDGGKAMSAVDIALVEAFVRKIRADSPAT